MTETPKPNEGAPPTVGVIDPDAFHDALPGLWRRWNRAWLRAPAGYGETWCRTTGPAIAGLTATWVLCYTVGGPGMKPGGRLIVGPAPLWCRTECRWQADDPRGAGFVTARIARQGAPLSVEVRTDGSGLSIVVVRTDTAIEPGGTVEIAVGDRSQGGPGWTVPRLATANLEFVVVEDLTGSGRFRRTKERAKLAVKSGPLKRLRASLRGPDTLGRCRLTLVGEDEHGNPAALRPSNVSLRDEYYTSISPTVTQTDSGTLEVSGLDIRVGNYGTLRVGGPGHKLDMPTPPADFMKGQLICFGDIHGSAATADAYGLPTDPDTQHDFFRWARDVEGLDFCAFTPQVEDDDPTEPLPRERFDALAAIADNYDDTDRFVTLVGYEWPDFRKAGSHLVLFTSEERRLVGPHHPEGQTLEKLCRTLKDLRPVIVPVRARTCVNWGSSAYRQFPELFTVAEIVSAWGSNEIFDALAAGSNLKGDGLRSALRDRLRLGFIGSSDTAWGRPNFVLTRTEGVRRPGLCAVIVDRLDRASVLEALRQRRCYATTGERIRLDVRLNGQLMGETVKATFVERHITIRCWAPERLAHIEIVKNGQLVYSHSCRGAMEEVDYRDYIVSEPVDYYYVRATLHGGGVAWSSPIWVEQAVW